MIQQMLSIDEQLFAQLKESEAQLAKNQQKLQKSIQMLHKAGLTAEEIADNLNENLETVIKLLS